MSTALRKLHTTLQPAARQHVRRLSSGGGPASSARCRCWPNPPCHHHQAGNCGYSQFQCDSSKATLPGVVGQGGAPVTVSHHPAAQQLQQAMQQGAQQVMGSLSQAGQQMVAAAASRLAAAHPHAHGREAAMMEPEFFTR